MKLKFDSKTFRAVGIGLLIASPVFVLLLLTAGAIPAFIIGVALLCGTVLVLVGMVQGMTLWEFFISMLRQAFHPESKPYSHEKMGSRIVVLTEEEFRNERR